jgi:hypothetical protein
MIENLTVKTVASKIAPEYTNKERVESKTLW